MTKLAGPYTALALQLECRSLSACSDADTARARMMESIDLCAERIRASRAFLEMFSGLAPRLVVLPEYFLSSYPIRESIADWQARACLAIDGPEYRALGDIARDQGVYLSGNAYELDAHFPEIYFQTSFIIDDGGSVILRYRRLVSMFAPTPHDILDAYLERYGVDSLFPVADTPLGRLACVASEEILYPEITRALALRGAEVICHSSSEVGSPRLTPKNIAKRARAYENMVYVVSANSGGITGVDLPNHSTDGHSQVVDHHGEVLAEAGYGESINGNARIDIDALRAARRTPGMVNVLSRQRLELFAPVYGGEPVHPANQLLDDGVVQVPQRAWFGDNQRAIIRRLQERGVI